jgi:hypothetical protein
MSQYSSRIHIKVTEPSVWEKFRDTDDGEFDLAELAEEGVTSFVLDDWFCVESELEGIVSALVETLGKDGVIIADTTNINVDPYAYIVYSAGYGVHVKSHNYSEYCFETSIHDLTQCLSYKNHFSFDTKELKILWSIGIERIKEGRTFRFREILVNEGLEEEIFLTETRFEGRTQRLETVKPGDTVRLVHDEKDKTYKNKVEVFSEEGSVGLLDEKSAEIMASILDAGGKTYTATVKNVIPQSKRAPRCQTGIISIHIQFQTEPVEEKKPKKVDTPAKAAGGAENSTFSYRQIDDVSAGFYEGIWNGKALNIPSDTTIPVTVGGKTVNVKLQTKRKINEIGRKFESALKGKENAQSVYDPISAIDSGLEINGAGEYQQYLYEVSDDTQELDEVQTAHRVKLFAKVVSLLGDEAVLAKIVQAAPKKKNGTLYVKRVTQVATLFCMAKDASMYVLCAVAKDDSNLILEIRTIVTSELEKTEADVISQTNLFRNT